MIMTSRKKPMKVRASRGLLNARWSITKMAAWAGLSISLSPLVAIIATLVLSTPVLAFEWTVMGTPPDNSPTMQYFTVWGLLLAVGLGPYFVLAGATILILAGILGAIKALFPRDAAPVAWRKTRIVSGMVCVALVAAMAAVPKGPDPCSRKWTGTAYEKCIVKQVDEMSRNDAKIWLQKHGYALSSDYALSEFSQKNAIKTLASKTALVAVPDTRFEIRRKENYPNIIPYGTVFNRLFSRIWGAGRPFKMYLYASSDADRIVAAQTDWIINWL